jgi:hypothetical protein
MFPATQPNLTAGGNILPNRFLSPNTGSGQARIAIQSSGSTALIFGVSEAYTRGYATLDDTYVAISGEPIPYRGPLQVAGLMLGGTVTDSSVPLTSDSLGRGVTSVPTAGTITYYGAIALDAGVSGDIIDVYVLPALTLA